MDEREANRELEEKAATEVFDKAVDESGLALLDKERQILWKFFLSGVAHGMDRVEKVLKDHQKTKKPNEWTQYDEMS